MRRRHVLSTQFILTAGLALLSIALIGPRPAAAGMFDMPDVPDVMPDWWTERFEVHGFVTTKLYGRSPGLDFAKEFEMTSLRSELNLEWSFDVYDGEDLRVGLYGVVRPIYEAIYDINPRRWGADARGGNFGTAPAYPTNNPIARDSGSGRRFPGRGSGIWGEYFLTNSDTGQLFIDGVSDCAPVAVGAPTAGGVPSQVCTMLTGKVPSVTIDDIVFFGRVTAPWLPISERQDKIGGNASGVTYRDYLNSPWRATAVAATFGLGAVPGAAQALENSLAASSMPQINPP